jgi:hypothetical protein
MFQIRGGAEGAWLQPHSSQSGIDVTVPRCSKPIPRLSEFTAPDEFHPGRLRLGNLRVPIVSGAHDIPHGAPIGWIELVILVFRIILLNLLGCLAICLYKPQQPCPRAVNCV